jgi:hypothetical protein
MYGVMGSFSSLMENGYVLVHILTANLTADFKLLGSAFPCQAISRAVP